MSEMIMTETVIETDSMISVGIGRFTLEEMKKEDFSEEQHESFRAHWRNELKKETRPSATWQETENE